MILKEVAKAGELGNTLVVISGDHGMPGVPGGKCNLYDHGVGVALIVSGPDIPSGRVVDDFVNMMDMAPTFLEAGGVTIPVVMTGRSIMNVLHSEKSGQVDDARTWVVTGRERHVAAAREGNLPYPQRALRTKEFLYIRNFAPERWPMGSPKFTSRSDMPSLRALEQDTFAAFADMDASPTKAWMVHQFGEEDWEWHYDYAFGKRPGEELYDLRDDPDETRNVADDPAYSRQKRELGSRLIKILTEAKDPRVIADPVPFERPPFTSPVGEGNGRVKKAGR